MISRVALLAALLVGCGASREPGATDPSGARGPTSDAAALAWLAGTWHGEGEAASHEAWTAPQGGVMRGVGWSGVGESHELLRIESDARGTRYIASPSDQPTTQFTLTSLEPGRAVFEAPEHDFPKRIEYTRRGDRLEARISGDADQPEVRFRFTRVDDPPAPRAAPGTVCREGDALVFTLEPCWCGQVPLCDVYAPDGARGEASDLVDVAPVVLEGVPCEACEPLTVRCALPAGVRRVTVLGEPFSPDEACMASPAILSVGGPVRTPPPPE